MFGPMKRQPAYVQADEFRRSPRVRAVFFAGQSNVLSDFIAERLHPSDLQSSAGQGC